MQPSTHRKTILAFSVPLLLLLIIASSIGLFTENFYSKETLNWQIQSVGQDMIDLFLIVPSLIITTLLIYRKKSFKSMLPWSGTLLYIVYTFIIFCFDVHFNSLFIVYCLILGLSLYAAAWSFYTLIKRNIVAESINTMISKATGIFFTVIAVVFYGVWLAEIIPGMIHGEIPTSLIETGLITNPVHVLDLSVFLPATFIIGILLLKKRAAAFLITPVLLFFFILMNITIGCLALLMYKKGITEDMSLAVVMMVLTVISIVLLVFNLQHLKIKNNERPGQ
jgi:hypothetical protein